MSDPIRMLEALIAAVPLPDGIAWIDADAILVHRPPDAFVHAWLVKLPIELAGKISVSRRLTFSIAEVTPEHTAAVVERVKAAIGEFQQALRDGVEDRIDDCGLLP